MSGILTDNVGRSSGLVKSGSGGSSSWTYQTAAATTSGTSVEFTSLASGIKHIWATFRAVGNTTDASLNCVIGDSGGYETSAYRSLAAVTSGDGVFQDVTSGFVLVGGTGQFDTNIRLTGMVELVRNDPSNHQWTCWGMLHGHHQTGSSDNFHSFSGTKELSAELDRVKFEISTGAYDTGAIIMHSE